MKKYNNKIIFIKILSVILLAVVLAVVSLNAIDFLARISNYYKYSLLKEEIYYYLGVTNARVIVISISFTFYLYILTRKSIKSFCKILFQLDNMIDGKKDIKIDITSTNEFGTLANNINTLVERMENAVEEERRSEKAKNELITNVSHDLRTPLTSIIGYLNIVDNDRYRDEVELRYYVEIAYEKAKVLDVLINDLFELTKMRNKGVTFNKHRVDIVELLGQLIASYKIQLDNINMVGRTFFSDERFIVSGDGSQLVRVFENLISNAMKYGCDSKYIDIITEVNDQWGKVIIKNYGEPIPEIDIPHIFNRFYKVDKSRTSEKRGSGLGLAIAKGIIEMHEGMISVESNYEGTAFIITLPLE